MGLKARIKRNKSPGLTQLKSGLRLIMFYQRPPFGGLFFLTKTKREVGFDYPVWPASLV